MNTSTIPHEKRSRATVAVKATSSKPEGLSKKSTAKVRTPKIEAISRPDRLLLERFPHPNQTRICLRLYAPDAQAVFVAGSFNDWQPSVTPLQKQDDGRWVVELVIEPGMYEYQFIVDGQWADDPLSSAYIANPFGGLNGVLVAAIQG